MILKIVHSLQTGLDEKKNVLTNVKTNPIGPIQIFLLYIRA